MSRRLLTAACACALATLGAPTALAAPQFLNDYTHAYNAAKRAGHDVGRNIVRDGYRTSHGVRRARRAEVETSTAVLRRWLAPPPTATASASTAQSPQSAGSSDPGLGSIRACESGGNYSTNTGNGFSGAYQFDDSTWHAAGGSTAHAYEASPAEQDRVAAGWIASGHRGAWPNC